MSPEGRPSIPAALWVVLVLAAVAGVVAATLTFTESRERSASDRRNELDATRRECILGTEVRGLRAEQMAVEAIATGYLAERAGDLVALADASALAGDAATLADDVAVEAQEIEDGERCPPPSDP